MEVTFFKEASEHCFIFRIEIKDFLIVFFCVLFINLELIMEFLFSSYIMSHCMVLGITIVFFTSSSVLRWNKKNFHREKAWLEPLS